MALTVSSAAQAYDSFICINEYKQIETDGYVHFVFDFEILGDDPVTVVDYADNYNKIDAVAVESDSADLGIEGFDVGFSLIIHRDQSFKPGAGFGDIGYMATLTYKNFKNYSIKCVQSGPVQLE